MGGQCARESHRDAVQFLDGFRGQLESTELGAVPIGFHHDRDQGLVDPPAAFEQSGEERPRRSFGIFKLGSPAVVVGTRGRVPLRWVERLSERSNGAAPMNAVGYHSITSRERVSPTDRIRFGRLPGSASPVSR